MRTNGIETFNIELMEEFEVIDKHDSKIGEKELEYYNKFKPTLNMISPKISQSKELGRIYSIQYKQDENWFYIGSTEVCLTTRLCQHKSASLKGNTPFYTFMRENGRENFTIKCIEDNVPINHLVIRENYWINTKKPTLNKNINLCITDKERDRLKYLKNKNKILEQANKRRLLKRDEINTQKRDHYHKNKERIADADKQKRKKLRETSFEVYTDSPEFIYEMLKNYTVFELKEIAKKFGLLSSPRKKEALISKILDKQNNIFPPV